MVFDVNFSVIQNEYSKIARIEKNAKINTGRKSGISFFFKDFVSSIEYRIELLKIERSYKSVSKKLVKSWEKIPKMTNEQLNNYHTSIIHLISEMEGVDVLYRNEEISLKKSVYNDFKETLFETSSRVRKAKFKSKKD